MRHAALLLLASLAIACERAPQVAAEEQAKHTEAVTPPPERAPREREVTGEQPEGPPPIPGLLLARLEIEREGSFALPEGTDELVPRTAVALGRGLALVGEAQVSREAPQAWRWVGFVPNENEAGEGVSTKLDTGSIHAAIRDGKGGALLAGELASGRDARAWFGALDAKGRMTEELELDGESATRVVELLVGHGSNERALVLGNVGDQGWVASVDSSGAVRWQAHVSSSGPTQIHAAARLGGERGDLLVIGNRAQAAREAWWGTIAGRGGADAVVDQGSFEIEGADPDQTLDAIVDLGDMGFVALGRASRDREQSHDQVIAVGFDRTGEPTWSRVLEHFRAIEIYGGAVNPELPGIANFVLRVPIGGGEHESALAWLDISPGVDGILVPRQLAGTVGWASAGFVEGREDAAILTYTRTEAGIDWRILPLATSYRVGSPK
jgi:hypothetical protein